MKENRTFLFLLLLIPLGISLLQIFYFQDAIENAYQGNPDLFIKKILDLLYPRFEVEKNRFDLSFFISKSNQVLLRFSIVYVILWGIYYFYKQSQAFQSRLERFRYVETTKLNIRYIRWIFTSYFLYLQIDLVYTLWERQAIAQFYKPLFWLNIVPIPYPSNTFLFTVGSLWIIASVFILFRKKTVLLSFFNAVVFVLFQAWFFSFEKIDHGYATFTYAALLIPFLYREEETSTEVIKSWPLRLIQFSIAASYLLSGLEKIFIAQTSWFKTENLKILLTFHETYLSNFIAQNDLLCQWISIFTILFQVGFILLLFSPKIKWVWLIGGVFFHAGIYFVMGVGHPFGPWVIVYLFFIDWSKINWPPISKRRSAVSPKKK